jgi:hypothetical protein
MNTPSTNLTILHDAKEWNTDIEGEIGEIMLDGKRLSDIHDLTRKVEGVAQSIKTLVLCLGAIVLICLVCNVGMATWIAIHDADIMEGVNATQKDILKLTNSNLVMGQKLESLGWEWKHGRWQQIVNTDSSSIK